MEGIYGTIPFILYHNDGLQGLINHIEAVTAVSSQTARHLNKSLRFGCIQNCGNIHLFINSHSDTVFCISRIVFTTVLAFFPHLKIIFRLWRNCTNVSASVLLWYLHGKSRFQMVNLSWFMACCIFDTAKIPQNYRFICKTKISKLTSWRYSQPELTHPKALTLKRLYFNESQLSK